VPDGVHVHKQQESNDIQASLFFSFEPPKPHRAESIQSTHRTAAPNSEGASLKYVRKVCIDSLAKNERATLSKAKMRPGLRLFKISPPEE
jgi:hypothetical protein